MRLRAITVVLALGTLALGGCDGIADSALGATADHRGFTPGEPVTGTVDNPDGAITVTLAPARSPRPADGANSTGPDVVACTDDDNSYSCPTDALAPGRYRVEVTDAKQAGEGTRSITVVLSENPDYEPAIATTNEQFAGESPGTGRFAVVLTGWEPGRPVVVYAIEAESGRLRPVATVTPDAAGQVRLRSPELKVGRTYAFLGDDGVWDERSADGWDVDYRLLEP